MKNNKPLFKTFTGTIREVEVLPHGHVGFTILSGGITHQVTFEAAEARKFAWLIESLCDIAENEE